MATTSFAQNGLVRIAYEIRGEGDQVVVLLHGLLSDRVALRPLADELEESARVVTIDLRGHGASSAIHGVQLQIDDLASDVIAVLDALEITEPVTIVGLEVGAMIAQRLQAMASERVGDVVAINYPATIAADGGLLRAIADRAYKGQIEPAVDQWLTLTWGADWKSSVPKPRIASARRSAGALHPILMALADIEVIGQSSIRVPGGTPFAEEDDLNRALERLREALG
ncbi:MAG: alpha/beta hydrolase [Thermomicrobiales bacterium]|nr:alpha/beta hydrolase [Thermomicrobiales bacterium]